MYVVVEGGTSDIDDIVALGCAGAGADGEAWEAGAGEVCAVIEGEGLDAVVL